MSKQMDFMANQVFAYFTLSEKNEYHPRMFALLAKATISVSLVDISLSFEIILCQKKISKKSLVKYESDKFVICRRILKISSIIETVQKFNNSPLR